MYYNLMEKVVAAGRYFIIRIYVPVLLQKKHPALYLRRLFVWIE